MTLLLGLLLFLPKILAGFAIAHLLWRNFDIPAILLKISIGIPLGFALSASLFFLSVLAGISPQTYSWIELWIVLPLDVLFLIRFVRSAKDSTYFSKPAWPDIAGAAVVFAGAFLFIVAFLFYSRQHRYGFDFSRKFGRDIDQQPILCTFSSRLSGRSWLKCSLGMVHS
jgi:hypothetical protein